MSRGRRGVGRAVAVSAVFAAGDIFAQSPPDPFAPAVPPGAAAGATQPPAAQGSAAGVPDVVTTAACQHVTKEVCAKSNTPLIATSVGYVIVCVVAMTVLRVWWNRRGTSSAGIRFMVPLFFGSVGAGILAAFDPLRGQDLICCLASGVFKAEILLQDSTAGRAVLLGALPAVVLFVIVAIIEKMMKR